MVKRLKSKIIEGEVVIPFEGLAHLGMDDGGECNIKCLDCGNIVVDKK
jgi:hypothetical protein